MSVAVDMRGIARIAKTTYGLRILEMPGWPGRGRPRPFHPRAVTCHHTGVADDADRILRDGRSDLVGPLCNFAVHRHNREVVLVAAGCANHAGVGRLSSSDSYGIEPTGPVRPGAGAGVFPDNYQTYVQLVAAICLWHGWRPAALIAPGVHVVNAHKEICQPAGRKPDPAFGMSAFRTAVAGEIRSAHHLEGDTDMGLTADDRKFITELVDDRVRMLDHGDPAVAGHNNHHQAILGRVASLTVAVDAVTARLDQLIAATPGGGGE